MIFSLLPHAALGIGRCPEDQNDYMLEASPSVCTTL